MNKLIILQDMTIEQELVGAVTRVTIPSTMQTAEQYAMIVYLKEVKEPLTQVYADEDFRNSEYELVQEAMKNNL